VRARAGAQDLAVWCRVKGDWVVILAFLENKTRDAGTCSKLEMSMGPPTLHQERANNVTTNTGRLLGYFIQVQITKMIFLSNHQKQKIRPAMLYAPEIE
jgi:hypothetical protein